jgi:hypothetical protein
VLLQLRPDVGVVAQLEVEDLLVPLRLVNHRWNRTRTMVALELL